jgi:uncharacterized membrane-anchored protein
MRPKVFRSAKWKQVHVQFITFQGVFLIVIISGFTAGEMMRVWPGWDPIVCGVTLVAALLLSWAWVKRVRKAEEEGEFD